jgi:hypothetical protein
MPSLSESEIKSMMTTPCQYFVETGTFMGDTTEVARRMFEKVYTIEVKEDLFVKARNRFKPYPSVTCYLGDSSLLLGDICKTLDKPTCFWLDGHYSAGNTGMGTKEVTLYEELDVIMTHCKVPCVILIDDCRLFGTSVIKKSIADIIFKKKGQDVYGWDVINVPNILEKVSSRLSSYSFAPSILHPQDRLAITLTQIPF